MSSKKQTGSFHFHILNRLQNSKNSRNSFSTVKYFRILKAKLELDNLMDNIKSFSIFYKIYIKTVKYKQFLVDFKLV